MLQKKLDLGQQAAERAADRAGEEWTESAYQVYLELLRKFGRATCCQIREFAECELDFPVHDEPRAWGAIATRASREGYARRIGVEYHGSITSHSSNHTIWEWVQDA